ncbi:hypothetical protein [Bosea sp. Tri-44]|uniref:hypothetical protein n=1 Tax=Bosea sp. Tri-44 TaxID=1972137 RepID=UPI0020C077F2|nr:hypothetical protein [Bosea sp. Tri-44]
MPPSAIIVRVEQDHVGGAGAHDVADVAERIGALVDRDRHHLRLAQFGMTGDVGQDERLLDTSEVEPLQLLELAASRAGRPGR